MVGSVELRGVLLDRRAGQDNPDPLGVDRNVLGQRGRKVVAMSEGLVGVPAVEDVLRGQTPEALTGDISLPRLDMCIAAAVRDGAALQSACVEQNFSSAIAAAAPDGVAVFVLGRCFFHAQMTDMKAYMDHVICHV